MAGITDGFKDVFLAGVGAVALGAEKSKELVDQLIAKGEITVEQGKEINAELKHRAVAATADLRDEALAVQMASMTPEERNAFAAKVAAMVAAANEQEVPAPEPHPRRPSLQLRARTRNRHSNVNEGADCPWGRRCLRV